MDKHVTIEPGLETHFFPGLRMCAWVTLDAAATEVTIISGVDSPGDAERKFDEVDASMPIDGSVGIAGLRAVLALILELVSRGLTVWCDPVEQRQKRAYKRLLRYGAVEEKGAFVFRP